MRKDNVIQIRISSTDKNDMKEWAKKEGVSLTTLIGILTTCQGPPAQVVKILSEHAARVSNALNQLDSSVAEQVAKEDLKSYRKQA